MRPSGAIVTHGSHSVFGPAFVDVHLKHGSFEADPTTRAHSQV